MTTKTLAVYRVVKGFSKQQPWIVENPDGVAVLACKNRQLAEATAALFNAAVAAAEEKCNGSVEK